MLTLIIIWIQLLTAVLFGIAIRRDRKQLIRLQGTQFITTPNKRLACITFLQSMKIAAKWIFDREYKVNIGRTVHRELTHRQIAV